MTGDGEGRTEDEIRTLARRAQARAAAAPSEGDILGLRDAKIREAMEAADRAERAVREPVARQEEKIQQANDLADRAISNARELVDLMQRLTELLLERENAEP